MVRLPRNTHASNRKSRHPHDIESTIYTLVLIVAAVLLVAYVLNATDPSTGLLLPPSVPIMTAGM